MFHNDDLVIFLASVERGRFFCFVARGKKNALGCGREINGGLGVPVLGDELIFTL